MNAPDSAVRMLVDLTWQTGWILLASMLLLALLRRAPAATRCAVHVATLLSLCLVVGLYGLLPRSGWYPSGSDTPSSAGTTRRPIRRTPECLRSRRGRTSSPSR